MDIKEKIQAVLDGIFATEMLDGEVSRENIVEGCLFHKWVSVSPPVSGMMKRGVTGHRRCAKCGMEQIRKPESGSGWHVSKKAEEIEKLKGFLAHAPQVPAKGIVKGFKTAGGVTVCDSCAGRIMGRGCSLGKCDPIWDGPVKCDLCKGAVK